jgi:hypothetical protein
MNSDELKQVWQSQGTGGRLTVDADVLLRTFRRSKQDFISTVFLGEGLMILGLVLMAALFVGGGILGLREGLPVKGVWGFFSLAFVCLAIAGYKGWDRFRQMKHRATASDPIRACLEENLDWVRHEIRLWNQQVLWWYLLPLAVGVLLLVFSVQWAVGGFGALVVVSNLPVVLGTAAFLWVAQWFCRWYVRRYYEPRQRELESLLQSLQSN